MNCAPTSYFSELAGRAASLGGLFNAHLHLDRAGTYEATLNLLQGDEGTSSFSLSKKHALIPSLHASDCYEPDHLEVRVEEYVKKLIAVGTTRADTVVDVTPDRVGLGALGRCLRIKDRLSAEIDLRVGAYTPLGFRDDEPQRWELREEGSRQADFIGALPERDDQADYPEHIGFEDSCRRTLQLAAALGKPLHIHVDQKNTANEGGSECIVRLLRELGMSPLSESEPLVWLVHVISPSAYDDGRFNKLLEGLLELNVGVICCPSAAISMRQVRLLPSPTHNSIARVLEMLAAGVHVRLGSDNICDITSPAGTVNLLDEVFVLCNAVRYYDLDILAKVAAGHRLNESERARITAHLHRDAQEVAAAARKIMSGNGEKKS
jgi:cytosine/adenosine deaminase-related metal-dependent hydrolase